ncbi:unnamed protein product [Lota lota]
MQSRGCSLERRGSNSGTPDTEVQRRAAAEGGKHDDPIRREGREKYTSTQTQALMRHCCYCCVHCLLHIFLVPTGGAASPQHMVSLWSPIYTEAPAMRQHSV